MFLCSFSVAEEMAEPSVAAKTKKTTALTAAAKELIADFRFILEESDEKPHLLTLAETAFHHLSSVLIYTQLGGGSVGADAKALYMSYFVVSSTTRNVAPVNHLLAFCLMLPSTHSLTFFLISFLALSYEVGSITFVSVNQTLTLYSFFPFVPYFTRSAWSLRITWMCCATPRVW
jgi:hypothetical protein